VFGGVSRVWCLKGFVVGMCLFISSKVLSRRSLSSNGRVASWVPSSFLHYMVVIPCPYAMGLILNILTLLCATQHG
jgi:hypothetical protein